MTEGVEVNVLIERTRDGERLSGSIMERRNTHRVDALRHACHPLHQLHGGRGLRDVQVPAESVDRDTKAVVLFGLLGEPGLLLL